MDLAQLEMLNAVAETGNITQAAARVHRVPSNLITRIRQLEADLGVDLFIHENQHLRLSPPGHNSLRYSQRILTLAEEARMVAAGGEPQGFLSLDSLESTAAVRIPVALTEYNQRYPKIQFALATGPSDTMLGSVLDGTLNAASADGLITHPGLEEAPAYYEGTTIVTPHGHPPIQWANDVNDCSIYALRVDCFCRRHSESWFHADRVMPGTTHEMESYRGMLACVIIGAGITLIPRSILESMPGHHQVNAWPLNENRRWLNIQLAWRRGAMTRQLEAFIEVSNPQLSHDPK